MPRKAKTAPFIPCGLRQLPAELLVPAAESAKQINPANAPPPGVIAALLKLLGDLLYRHLKEEERPEIPPEPQYIAMVTSKYWGPAGKVIPTYFMDTQDTTLKNALLAAFNSWGDNIKWVESSQGNSLARIARQKTGYWSYIGTDYEHIPKNQPTLNLQSWTRNMPASEWLRVPTHESGHARGYPHEHMRKELVAMLDVQKTIDYFGQTQGWSPQEVRDQVLTPLDDATILGTPPDQDSIMCYQLPGSITTNGQPIRGGTQINATDRAFSLKMYPVAVTPPTCPPGQHWDATLQQCVPDVVTPPPGATVVVTQDILKGTYQRVS